MERKEILLQLRERQRLSQQALAEEIGVTRQTISNWENGVSAPSSENLIALSRVYGVTAEEMFQGWKEKSTEAVEGEVKKGTTPPDAPDAALKKPGRKKVWPVVSIAVVAIFASIYFWGVFTNSINSAKLTIAFFGVIMLLGAGAFGIYRMWKEKRNG